MGIVKISDLMHENLRVAGNALSRSINAQAEHWMRVGMLTEMHPDLDYREICQLLIQAELAGGLDIVRGATAQAGKPRASSTGNTDGPRRRHQVRRRHRDGAAGRQARRGGSGMIEPHVVPGVSTDRLDQICHEHIVNVQGAIPANVGYLGYPKTILTSVNQVVCHGIPRPTRS
jgi:hypothetical protein